MNLTEFISKANLIHNNKYDYSQVNYNGSKTKVNIICPIHGIFPCTPSNHIYKKNGCVKCRRLTIEEFISKANLIHNNKYDYSQVKCTDPKLKINIICPVHGIFSQILNNHLQGRGCKDCANSNKSVLYISTVEEFIQKARLVHGDKYDYLLVNYNGAKTKVNIICPVHGIFPQVPANHIQGRGCKDCGTISSSKKNSLTTEEFIQKAKLIHGDKYDYSQVDYTYTSSNVDIICPIHGIFPQVPYKHLLGQGCKDCKEKIPHTLTTEEFIQKAKLIHSDKYDYSQVDYTYTSSNVNIICKVHGTFPQTPSNHLQGCGCPKCTSQISKGQKEVFNFIQNLIPMAILEDRTTYPGLFLDITIPDKNLAIEYNGVYWHSINHESISKYMQKDHLKDKMLKAQELGLRVINIYEDEWQNSRSQIEQIIKNALGVIETKIMARKCKIWSILTDDPRWNTHIKLFFEKFHHQGLKYKPDGVAYCIIRKEDIEKLLDDTAKKLAGDQTSSISEIRSKINWEMLITPDLIQACAYFGSNSYHNQNDCELIRYATKADVKVVGGLSKLVKNFLLVNPQVKKIKSYCDARLFTGDGYRKAGFRFVEHSAPDFDVIVDGSKMIRKHRSCIIKKKLSSYFNEETLKSKTQMELAADLGWYVVPDCGQIVFEYF